MSQQSDPTVFPPCRRDGEGCTTPAANSVHDSSGPASTGASLSLSKTPNLIHPAEASVATSTQPDSQRYPVPTNPHLGTDFSSARLFASSDTGNHPATADLEVGIFSKSHSVGPGNVDIEPFLGSTVHGP